MSSRPIFVATHPRACSTAFERVFMTQRDSLECVHEPFGDAFYYGPERLSQRFENDEAARVKSGFAATTYKDVMNQLDEKAAKGKRLFIKDIAHYIFPPDGMPARPAPSLVDANAKGSAKPGTIINGSKEVKEEEEEGRDGKNGVVENPTVMPIQMLRQFHFTFLIRHPRRSIPSYYRCTVPPLDEVTGFHTFMPSEAGYDELRRLFDFLRTKEMIGPARAGEANGASGHASITVVDADDLLDKPAEIIEKYCAATAVDFTPDMLRWEDQENQQHAVDAFKKWNGFHEDVIDSTYLRPRIHGVKSISAEEEDNEWREKYGSEGQKVIRACVDANVADYEYLKSFAIKV